MLDNTNQYFIYGTVISLRKFDTIEEIDDDVHGIFSSRIGKFVTLELKRSTTAHMFGQKVLGNQERNQLQIL